MEMDPMLSGISTGYPEYAHHVTEAEMEAVTQVMSEAAVSRITTGEFDYQAMAGAAETGESDSGAVSSFTQPLSPPFPFLTRPPPHVSSSRLE